MKFKTHISKEIKHNGILSCLDWCGGEEVSTCNDDHQIFKWSTTTRESMHVAKLPEDFYPTDLCWLLSKTSGSGKNGDALLITSTDGRFIILNRSARVEKNITAHTGAIASGRWSPDGAGLLTAGEDGIIKIFSRSGMLRSTVVQNESSILCARWSPNSLSIIYCQGGFITIKPLAANSKITKWRAHDGLVLSVCWAKNTNLIVSGGEDCKYKIWDTQGTLMYTSSQDDHAITSVEFSPSGELLAVGSFNSLKLCHSSGWIFNNTRFSSPNTGSIFGIRWTHDSTQIVSGCGSGALIFGHVIEREKISRNLKAVTTGRKTILLQDIVAQTDDTLDFSDRIIQWELGYGHLVVATNAQVQIFSESYINTPIIIDNRADVRFIKLGKKNFLCTDYNSLWVYTYSGRLHLNPRYPGSQSQIPNLITLHTSLGIDVLCVRDFVDQTIIHVFDLLPGASRQDEPFTIKSPTVIIEIAMCRSGTSEDQYLVFVDVNRDLYLTNIRNGPDFPMFKIGTQVVSVMWASDANILVGLHDSSYSVWYCPGEACSDPTLIALTMTTNETNEFGKNVSIENFDGCMITFCCDGIKYTIPIKIYCEAIHKCINDGMWNQALKICRLAQNPILWSTLGTIASKKNQLDISEEAFANALQIDKVHYLQYIKSLPETSPDRMAEISIMNGRIAEAEIILLHNKKITEAIGLSIRMHRWERALDIALKNETGVDTVLEERKKYLQALDRDEMNPKYLNYINSRKN